MDITMSIATLSTQMSQASLNQSVDISMVKKTMETQESSANNLLEMISTATPSFNHKIDIKA